MSDTGLIQHVIGKPPKWVLPARRQLREDDGDYYCDPNAARYPQYPTEPAVRSVFLLNQAFDTSNVDIFSCGKIFYSLLSFASHQERTFRFGVERIGETLFLVRKTNTPQELLYNVRGYGHTFSEACTVWEPEVKGSASHQRIISYDFAGLQCMIRTQCDGYFSDKSPAIDLTSDIENTAAGTVDFKRCPSLAINLSALTVSALIKADQPAHQSAKLTLEKAGHPIHQHAIFDLKTRNKSRKHDFNMSELTARLWTNQTRNFIIGWHTRGIFDQIEIKDVRHKIADWELAHRKALGRFRSLLKDLIEFSQGENQSRFEVRRIGRGDLEIWSEVEGWSALPTELKARWSSTLADHAMRQEDSRSIDIDCLKFAGWNGDS